MSTEYGKLIDSELLVLNLVPGILNPTDEEIKDFAEKNGFKIVVRVPAPGRYYDLSYVEDETTITENWIVWELDDAKKDALDEVQTRLSKALSKRIVVSCPNFNNGIIYDQDALTNVLGLEEGDNFIDAVDEVHVLTSENITDIKKSLKTYRLSLYENVTVKRAAINVAETVEEVERALNDLNI